MPIAAIVVNWNSYVVLTRCLQALKSQRLPFDHIVVVDNASDPPIQLLEGSFPAGVEYVRLDKNVGFAAANNIAMQRLETCEWVALVNPDAFLEPGWLEEMVSALRRYPNCAAFASKQINASSTGLLDGLGDAYHISGKAWRRDFAQAVEHGHAVDQEVFSACAAAALYNRKAWLQVGGMDEDFFCYFEDVDIGFRLRLAGYRTMLIPAAVAYHVGSAVTGGRHGVFAIYYGHRNLVWAFVKNMPGSLFWILLPIHLMFNVVALGYFVLHGSGATVLRAKVDAIKGLPAVWAQRKKIQSTRIATVKEIWRTLDKRLVPSDFLKGLARYIPRC